MCKLCTELILCQQITVFNRLYKAQSHIIALHSKYALIQTEEMKLAEGAAGGEEEHILSVQ